MGPRPEALSSPAGHRVAYCDSSAILRAYLADEDGHEQMRHLLAAHDISVVTSALADVEITAAVFAAARGGRIDDPAAAIAEIAADEGGPLVLIALDGAGVLALARALCERHRLRALDAIHLAVALTDAQELADGRPFVFITRDADQAAAARAEGLVVEYMTAIDE